MKSCVYLSLILFLAACGGGNGVLGLPPPVATPGTIDGSVDFNAFAVVETTQVEIRDGSGTLVKTADLRWAFRNDDRQLYVALEWNDDTFNNGYDLVLGPTDFDGVKLLFDSNGDGALESGEDERIVIAASVGSLYVDQHLAAGDESDAIGDGFASLRYVPATQTYQAEFLIPLLPDANGEDGPFSAATRYSILLYDHVDLGVGTGNLGAPHGTGPSTLGWPLLPLVDAGPHDHPQLPDDLTGLIAFASTHQEPNGEIYTFDPATGIVRQVTNDPNLYKDNVSLSHDRTRIAFHASTDRADFANYEIYTVHVDGTNLTQLTNNSILDGHPGWSPDDTRLAYASFRDGGAASIVIMADDGTEIADLTPAGVDDNDPDYLPDGRLVFKTDRFSQMPQVRIAVMNEDGTGVSQLTNTAGVSDHDPVGDGVFAVFERFSKDTDYATDIETGFVPWDLVETRLDGTGERVLLSDGWVNWLPVYDPSGRYVVQLKSANYTAAHLLARDGRDLGRLIPGITRLTYIDWK
jgi:hypothetical protein